MVAWSRAARRALRTSRSGVQAPARRGEELGRGEKGGGGGRRRPERAPGLRERQRRAALHRQRRRAAGAVQRQARVHDGRLGLGGGRDGDRQGGGEGGGPDHGVGRVPGISYSETRWTAVPPNASSSATSTRPPGSASRSPAGPGWHSAPSRPT